MTFTKKTLIFLSLFALVCSIAIFSKSTSLSEQINALNSTKHPNCPFCNQRVLDYQSFYENKHVIALFNHRPLLEGHVLILPKRHVERLENLSPEEFAEIGAAIKLIQGALKTVYHKEDYFIAVQTGKDGGQTVPHTHFHMIPRGSELTSLTKASLWLSFLTDVTGLSDPIKPAEMYKQTDALKAALSNQSY